MQTNYRLTAPSIFTEIEDLRIRVQSLELASNGRKATERVPVLGVAVNPGAVDFPPVVHEVSAGGWVPWFTLDLEQVSMPSLTVKLRCAGAKCGETPAGDRLPAYSIRIRNRGTGVPLRTAAGKAEHRVAPGCDADSALYGEELTFAGEHGYMPNVSPEKARWVDVEVRQAHALPVAAYADGGPKVRSVYRGRVWPPHLAYAHH
ncbi:hypothetical protein ACIQU6_07525 [Streptomyces sp. NPDC090442]|uniref:hypothetical protein n=1 Tax=Streptomyces sp. NPDC090442 TaxID=3365962 RepID=UPI0038185553